MLHEYNEEHGIIEEPYFGDIPEQYQPRTDNKRKSTDNSDGNMSQSEKKSLRGVKCISGTKNDSASKTATPKRRSKQTSFRKMDIEDVEDNHFNSTFNANHDELLAKMDYNLGNCSSDDGSFTLEVKTNDSHKRNSEHNMSTNVNRSEDMLKRKHNSESEGVQKRCKTSMDIQCVNNRMNTELLNNMNHQNVGEDDVFDNDVTSTRKVDGEPYQDIQNDQQIIGNTFDNHSSSNNQASGRSIYDNLEHSRMNRGYPDQNPPYDIQQMRFTCHSADCIIEECIYRTRQQQDSIRIVRRHPKDHDRDDDDDDDDGVIFGSNQEMENDHTNDECSNEHDSSSEPKMKVIVQKIQNILAEHYKDVPFDGPIRITYTSMEFGDKYANENSTTMQNRDNLKNNDIQVANKEVVTSTVHDQHRPKEYSYGNVSKNNDENSICHVSNENNYDECENGEMNDDLNREEYDNVISLNNGMKNIGDERCECTTLHDRNKEMCQTEYDDDDDNDDDNDGGGGADDDDNDDDAYAL